MVAGAICSPGILPLSSPTSHLDWVLTILVQDSLPPLPASAQPLLLLYMAPLISNLLQGTLCLLFGPDGAILPGPLLDLSPLWNLY
eukprot:1905006-Rhodomonas_salina.1